MFAAIRAINGADPEVLAAVAREFSPRIELHSCQLSVVGCQRGTEPSFRQLTTDNRQLITDNRQPVVTLDLAGVTRLFGDAPAIAAALRRTAAEQALQIGIAMAGTRTAARLLVLSAAHGPVPTVIVPPGAEPQALESLPIAALLTVDDTVDLQTLRRWGLRSLGELAALPAAAVAARLGQDGVRWQRLARGEDPAPLIPAVSAERFEQALDLEWPIEDLEPLSFVLGRLIEPLSAHLERRGRGAAVLHVRLHLIKGADGTRAIHERSLQLPVAMRDARTLRTLALLDLESHPPAAPIDRVAVAVDPTPERIVQFSLLTRPLPSPEQISTLNARLAALMGEGRCGSPVAVDSWRPGAVAMKPFAPVETTDIRRDGPQRHSNTEFPESEKKDLCASVSLWPVAASIAPVVALRRFRHPVPARVGTEGGSPYRVVTDRRGLSGGRVEACAGPWRTSGAWWESERARRSRQEDSGEGKDLSRRSRPEGSGEGKDLSRRSRPEGSGEGGWDRDEWDVSLGDGATYRIFRERHTDAWFVDGVID